MATTDNPVRWKAVAEMMEFLPGKTFKWGKRSFDCKKAFVKNGNYCIDTKQRMFVLDATRVSAFLETIVIQCETPLEGSQSRPDAVVTIRTVRVNHAVVKKLALSLTEAYVYSLFEKYKGYAFGLAEVKRLMLCLVNEPVETVQAALSGLEKKKALKLVPGTARRWKYVSLKEV